MNLKSRTEYSAVNTSAALLSRAVAILMGFVTRLVFTHTLNESYVGINGLFTDILNILSLTELGVGTAITYALYRPIAEKNIEKQQALMRLFQLFYRLTALSVALLGLAVVPFLDVLIKNKPDVEHLTFIYLLYLANSVFSYLLVYKRTLVEAHQMNYIVLIYQTAFLVLQDVCQIIVLVTTRNFILFSFLYMACTLLGNIFLSRKADRLFPYLREKSKAKLPKGERREIFRNIRAMLMHKVGNVVVNNTDNLLISSFVGVVSVGIYSNYFLLIGSVRQVLDQIFAGITASVGNLGVTEDRSRVQKVFEIAFFVGQWMYGFAAICLYELLNPFVKVSFGKQYLFPSSVVLILCINFFINGTRKAVLTFRDSLGLFWYDRYKAVVEAVLNIILSILLVRGLGTLGVFIGTFISTVATSVWVEPYVLYRFRLKAPVLPFFLKYAGYCVGIGIVWNVTELICRNITGGFVYTFGLRLVVCVLAPNALLLLFYGRTKVFRSVLEQAKKILGRKKGKAKKTEPQEKLPTLKKEEKLLCEFLQEALTGEEQHCGDGIDETDLKQLFSIAEKHKVLSLLYDVLTKRNCLLKEDRDVLERKSREIVRQSYHLLFLTRYIVKMLTEKGIRVIVLKGCSTAEYYPVPELRKSGDVDLLFMDGKETAHAAEVLEQVGFRIKEVQETNHHIGCFSSEGIEVELHQMLTEPFDSEKINRYLKECQKKFFENRKQEECMGVELPVLSEAHHTFYLLLHMLQHFLRSGFGLKLLCDWVVVLNHMESESVQEEFYGIVQECGLLGFTQIVTAVCVKYLGLSIERAAFLDLREWEKDKSIEEFLQEIFEAEEFGKGQTDRMLALRGTSLTDYLRELHHQMKLNYPRAGKWPVLYPVLWCMAIAGFLWRNRSIRKVSGWAILRKAAKRGRFVEKMRLFKK